MDRQPFSEIVINLDLSNLTKPQSTKSPSQQFHSSDDYIAYFEPLIITELRSEFSAAVEKFERDGGELNAFKATRPPEPRRAQARRKSDDCGCAMRAVVLFGKAERNFQIAEMQPIMNPQMVNFFDGDALCVWTYRKSAPRQERLKVPPDALVGVIDRVNQLGNINVKLCRPSGKAVIRDGTELVLMKLGGYVTYQRERDALYRIARSSMLPDILRPGSSKQNVKNSKATQPQFFERIVYRNGLNPSQADAVISAVKATNGFGIIQGPPGTGKTRTLVALLNVIHMTEYQRYYESFLRSIQVNVAPQEVPVQSDLQSSANLMNLDGRSSGRGGLPSLLASLNRTLSTLPRTRYKRPRLLICAPSNAAVDEALTRITNEGFIDASGQKYSPELARLGAKDSIMASARFVSGEGQAEAFMDRALGPYSGRGPHPGDPAIMQQWIEEWKQRTSAFFQELNQTKRSPETAPKLVDIHEQLGRLERDMRRFDIAASRVLQREDKIKRIERTYIEDAQLVFATLSGVSTLMNARGVGDLDFEILVVDEAAQATEPSTIIPLAFGVKKCMLVGDPQQLPATVFSTGASKVAYGQSLLERLVGAGIPVLLLDTQYRMHPSICQFPSRHFYNSRLKNGSNVEGNGRVRSYHEDVRSPCLGPYVFIDVRSGSEERNAGERSMFNSTEANLAASLVSRLVTTYKKELVQDNSSMGIGVVTPYRKQLQALRKAMTREKLKAEDVEVDTVDAFQGREKDVIIFSCVRTTVARGIGFVRDMRRLNVGITRARCSLIILGNAAALSAGSKDWSALITDAQSRGALKTMNDFTNGLSVQNTATESLGSTQERDLMSDSVGSGSESTSLRDPRKRREEERKRLRSTTGIVDATSREGDATSRVDPRKRPESTNARKGVMTDSVDGSSEGGDTDCDDLENFEKYAKTDFGSNLNKYLLTRKRKAEQSARESNGGRSTPYNGAVLGNGKSSEGPEESTSSVQVGDSARKSVGRIDMATDLIVSRIAEHIIGSSMKQVSAAENRIPESAESKRANARDHDTGNESSSGAEPAPAPPILTSNSSSLHDAIRQLQQAVAFRNTQKRSED